MLAKMVVVSGTPSRRTGSSRALTV
jgi:hypothetical protein